MGYNTKRTHMDAKLYTAAIEGDINALQQQGIERINMLLTPNKNTVLHVHLTASSEALSDEFMTSILKLCPALFRQTNSKGETPLHIAARYGHSSAVQILLDHSRTIDEDVVTRATEFLRTIKKFVKSYRESEFEGIYEYLLGLGATKWLIRATSIVGDSALHEAVRYNHFEAVRLLIDEDPDYPYFANQDGETPLYIAVERRYEDIVSEILYKCNSPAYGGPDGRTALHSAVIRGDQGGLVQRLLEKDNLKCSIKEADKQGCLPLHLAVQHHNDVEILLEHDDEKKTAYMRDEEGRTALHLAAIQNNTNSMKVILSDCPDCAEIVDNNGRNALHYAVSGSSDLSTAKLIAQNQSLSNLYNAKDVEGSTPLHRMVSCLNYVPELIEHQRVDKFAFNKGNLTASDIIKEGSNIDDDDDRFKEQRSKIKDSLAKFDTRKIEGQRIKTSTSKKEEEQNKAPVGDEVRKVKDSYLVAATLIATVTFAAGFTMPGGTIQEGEHQGTPILKHNAAFQVFVVADTIALVLSSAYVLLHLWLGISKEKLHKGEYLGRSFVLIMFAMASMMIAFATGAIAMLGVSSGPSIFMILFSSPIIAPVCVLLLVVSIGLVYPFIGCFCCFSFAVIALTEEQNISGNVSKIPRTKRPLRIYSWEWTRIRLDLFRFDLLKLVF